jgi:putative ABC transport system permease protein
VVEPEGLYILSLHGAGFYGKPGTFDDYPYPLFRQLRGAVNGQAELLAVSFAERIDLTYGWDQEMEKAHVQYISGSMFGSFGLQPVLGRLLAESDDLTPGVADALLQWKKSARYAGAVVFSSGANGGSLFAGQETPDT